MPLSATARLVVTAFVASGTTHLARPRVFEPLMPRWVPAHREMIVASGAAELLCAAGLGYRPTRRAAAYASAALLVAVFPGNVKMALDASRHGSMGLRTAAYARLPLQVPMVVSMLRAARRGR
ncbi:hypothetical protein AB3X52_04780 [Nocardioides sp. DS6]|uniref:DoxX family protein n=1 Tax=Nocardioides eburneus TaxID=3231482 RepID=A0ABV3SVP1_9ACTN